MSEWQDGTLSDIADVTMGYSPKGETCNNAGEGVPLLNGPTEFGIRYPTPVQYTTNPLRTSARNDILFCVRGSTTGRMNWGYERYAIGRGLAAIRHKMGDDFQYFVRAAIEFQLPTLLSTATGSTFPSVSREQIEKLEVYVPPIPEQRAIARVLSSLDGKIDLLHRQNKTLEALAETLFRQWFVEEASDEWEARPLSRVANFLNGLACQKFPPLGATDRLPVLKIKELSGGISDNSDFASASVKSDYIVNAGDVIFSWSASLIVKIWDGERCVLNQHLFKVTSAEFPKWFVFQWCKHHLEEFIAISSAHATTMGHIKRGDLDNAVVTVPTRERLEEMTKTMAPLLQKTEANNQQIRTLQKLRDTLLPKLMSGEVRVQYA